MMYNCPPCLLTREPLCLLLQACKFLPGPELLQMDPDHQGAGQLQGLLL
jgi:hypothetical protein